MALTKQTGGLGATYVPGKDTINTVGKMFPNNATNRPNALGGNVDLSNGLGSFPKDFNQGLAKQWENVSIKATTFEAHLASRGFDNYRQVFDKVTIPLHANTLSMTFMKSTGIDERPETAAITGLATTWNPTWNEVAITGNSVEVTTNAYGRFYKKHRFADDISTIRWFEELANYFMENSVRTMDNLAGVRLYEGSNKIFVNEVKPYDATKPYEARLTLGTDTNGINSYLTFDSLLEAVFQMENYEETYNTVENGGTIKSDNKRNARIAGYYGDNIYLALVSSNGYNQLLKDPAVVNTFVLHGGFYQKDVAEKTLGITSPFLRLQLQIVSNPITVSKAITPTAPKVFTDGKGELECAFVMGGGANARIGVELSLEGYTKMIMVPYEDDKKVDPFSLLSLVGWMTVTDFSVINNEALYCIPHMKHSNKVSGTVIKPTNPTWKP